MNNAIRAVASGVLLILFASTTLLSETKTITGKVSCSMCRGKHQMGVSNDADCARKCVKYGAKYILISGDDIYVIAGDPRQLDFYADKTVTIRGEVEPGSIVKVEAISVVK